jgi:hypothetical protein
MKARLLGRLLVGTVALGVVGSAGLEAGAQQSHVTFCHATGSKVNPYVTISPSVSGTYRGHYLHHDRDIIPPFEYQGKTYSLNWDAEGRATFDNDCVPAKAPKPPQVQGEPPIVHRTNFTG